MQKDLLATWQLIDIFSGKELAALVMGLAPQVASDNDITAVLRRVERDYQTAVWAHREIINPTDGPFESVTEVPKTSLQSRAMYRITNRDTYWDEEYNPHRVWDWLIERSDEPGEYSSSTFENQVFERQEIVRWLKENNIRSDFFLGQTHNNETMDDQSCISEKLRILNEAARQWWSTAERDNRAGHPTSNDVAAWLVSHGYEQSLADRGATIIRPEWAGKGRKPKK